MKSWEPKTLRLTHPCARAGSKGLRSEMAAPCLRLLRQFRRARTVASMKASSNNRWRGP